MADADDYPIIRGVRVGAYADDEEDRTIVYQAGAFVPASTGQKYPGRPQILSSTTNGGTAGDHSVPGITVLDDLVSVIEFDTGVPTDRTAEFSITTNGVINNADGTNTTGDTLMIHYSRSRGFDLTGVAFSDTEDLKFAATVTAPLGWPSVVINMYALAASFGSGNVRLYHSGEPDTAVNVPIAAGYSGELAFPTAPTWTAITSTLQAAQLSLTRMATHTNDTLDEPLAILAIYLTPGD